jgi:nitrogen regulatory protein PII 2
MKEITAIIRPRMVGATKDALARLGLPSVTAASVLGRGKQRGIAEEVDVDMRPEALEQGRFRGMKYIPKRMLTLVVHDCDADRAIGAIIQANQTKRIGDGKIFVCPVDGALRIRTGETGESAIM